MQPSQLHFYSIGKVLANKPTNTDIVQIIPIEVSQMADGELSSTQANVTATSQNSDGTSYQVNAVISDGVQAIWLPFGSSNRKTSPDVAVGEEVMLWQFADAEPFYWTTRLDGADLRSLETVIYQFKADPAYGNPATSDNTYYFKVDTRNKLITFSTSKINEEPFRYTIQLNTGIGCLNILDDVGNLIMMNSKEHQIALKNAEGSYFDLNKQNLTVNVPGTYSVKCGTYNLQSSGEVTVNGSNINVTGSSSVNIKSSSSVTISSPSTDIS